MVSSISRNFVPKSKIIYFVRIPSTKSIFNCTKFLDLGCISSIASNIELPEELQDPIVNSVSVEQIKKHKEKTRN